MIVVIIIYSSYSLHVSAGNCGHHRLVLHLYALSSSLLYNCSTYTMMTAITGRNM